MLRFEWDEAKNESNRRKHGVSFEEARTVFFDEEAIEYPDPDHSDFESRFLMIGRSFRFRVLLVCHCFRESDSIIRIISARKATQKERKTFARRGKP
ncbi:MAG TPA: BrnT family toxin [Acidobacteriota bacterium]|nr:BrnT family toxin [Acidobacteriota bacterium]